jgi:hypothetical protein
MPHRTSVRRAPRLAVLGLLGLAATAAGCGGADPFAPRASLSTASDVLTVYPYSGDPALPAGIDPFNGLAVRPRLVGTRPNFEVAVDAAAGGRVLLRTVRTLLVAPGGTPQVGLRTVAQRYDSLTAAPTDGYVFDSTLTVNVGQTVALRSSGLTCTPNAPYSAKLVVDSITAGGGFAVRITTNPNCGFRSFASGLPTF